MNPDFVYLSGGYAGVVSDNDTLLYNGLWAALRSTEVAYLLLAAACPLQTLCQPAAGIRHQLNIGTICCFGTIPPRHKLESQVIC